MADLRSMIGRKKREEGVRRDEYSEIDWNPIACEINTACCEMNGVVCLDVNASARMVHKKTAKKEPVVYFKRIPGYMAGLLTACTRTHM